MDSHTIFLLFVLFLLLASILDGAISVVWRLYRRATRPEGQSRVEM